MSVDYLLKGGTIIDGSSPDVPPIQMDIAIEGDSIKDIGELSHVDADRTIDVKGLIVCPGFIDAHAHSEFSLLADGRAEGKISQGVTTEINGNCGLSAAPLYGPALERRESELDEINITDRWQTFSEYFRLLEARKFGVNFVTLAGHGNIRASVVGYSDKSLSKSDMEKMIALLRTSMEEGAIGLSTGLIYPPGIYSGTPEIIGLAQEAAKYNGIYTTHMRSEGDDLLESVEEVINIAAKAGIHAHISHIKTSGEKNWNKLHNVFTMIEEARGKGISMTCDRYPYTASSTDLDTVLPSWAFEGGHEKEISRLKNQRAELTEDILKIYSRSSDWDKVVISSVRTDKNRWMEGKSIPEISRVQGKTELQTVFDILLDEGLSAGAIFFTMNEDNLKAILKRPYCAIGTDSAVRSFSGITAKGMPHPRGFGSFPRVLGRYVRELGTLTLSEAVYKMSGLSADIFKIRRRGALKKGFFADITIFDPLKIIDTADYSAPFRRPEGIYHVFINGKPVLLHGELTGELPGRVLR
ncbi:MAG: D-aminoacylase [Nitrospirae bacterium]|nr:D-aminoacylase [Nitrospirota bacterium]